MVCPTCGIEFKAHQVQQKYCSLRCTRRAASRRQYARYREKQRARKRAYYWSHREQILLYLKRHREKKRRCAFCGAEFEIRDRRQKYCSAKCRSRAGWQRYFADPGNRAKILARRRAHYWAHREEELLAAKRRRWYGVSGVR